MKLDNDKENNENDQNLQKSVDYTDVKFIQKLNENINFTKVCIILFYTFKILLCFCNITEKIYIISIVLLSFLKIIFCLFKAKFSNACNKSTSD